MSEPAAGRRGTPAISVLLPCRDAAPWLEACIASLEDQTEASFEVLAVDDASADHTRVLLDAWAARDSRVRVLEGAGEGLVAALSLAAAAARAPLLARMDADDVAHPRRLRRQRRFLADHPELAGCGTGIRYFPRAALGSGYRRYERWLNSLRRPEELWHDLFVECPVAHPSLVLRAADYRAVGGYRERGWPEDYDLVLRLYRAGRRLANLDGALLRWRVTSERLSATGAGYQPAAFQRCKAHHLARGFLPAARPLAVWGAGKVGKGLARALLAEGVSPEAFVDLDPRKIGQQIHGAPVVRPQRLAATLDDAYVLVAVGSPGARAEIRAALDAMGRREIEDFRVAA